MTGEVVLGFDFGARRIGVALGNSVTRQARPLRVVDSEPNATRWAAIARAVEEWQPARFIVGLPRHPDGTEHEMTRRALRFGRQLAGRYGKPVAFVDERYSSVVLESARDNDAEAAAVILQQWFDEMRPVPAGPSKAGERISRAPTPITDLRPPAGEGGFESSGCANDEDREHD